MATRGDGLGAVVSEKPIVKAVVAGAAGRMGQQIIHIIQATKEAELFGVFERPDHPDIGKNIVGESESEQLYMPIHNSFERTVEGIRNFFSEYKENKEIVLVDFTNPEAALAHAKIAAAEGIAFVTGTTGIKGDILKEIEGCARSIPIVMAPNMSVGVNVMFKIAEEMARILGAGYDMEIFRGASSTQKRRS